MQPTDVKVLDYYVDQLCTHYGTKLTIQDKGNTSSKYDIILIPHQATTVSLDHGEVGEAVLVLDNTIFNSIIHHKPSRLPIKKGSTVNRTSSTRTLQLNKSQTNNKYLKYKQKYLALKNQLNN